MGGNLWASFGAGSGAVVDTLTTAERGVAAGVHDALHVALAQFAEHVAERDARGADRWAALAFGLMDALAVYERGGVGGNA